MNELVEGSVMNEDMNRCYLGSKCPDDLGSMKQLSNPGWLSMGSSLGILPLITVWGIMLP